MSRGDPGDRVMELRAALLIQRGMRVLLVIASSLLAGCATQTSLEDLERKALATGEWSAVEAREQAIVRRNARLGPECPGNLISVCVESGSTVDCICVAPAGQRL